MSEGRRLPVIAPAPVPAANLRLDISSATTFRRHIATVACLECRAKKRKCSGQYPCVACTGLGIKCRLPSDRKQSSKIQKKRSSLDRGIHSLEENIHTIAEGFHNLARNPLNDAFPKAQGDGICCANGMTVRYDQDERNDALQETNPKTVALSKKKINGGSQDDWSFLWPIYEKLCDAQIGLAGLQAEIKLMERTMKIPVLCDKPIYLVPAKPWTTVTDNDNVVSHLISLYFTWDYPCYTFFDRELFLTDMMATQPRFCSRMLVNAILAHACLYSYSLKRPWDRFNEMNLCLAFLSEAQKLWTSQPEPSLTSIQALCIMNLTYNCLGKDKVGWGCLAAAFHMADKMRLFEPISKTHGDPDWARVQAATAWGLFEWQTLVAPVVFGAPRLSRPPFMDLPFLNFKTLDIDTWWHPYPFRAPAYPASVFATSRAKMDLSQISNDINQFTLSFTPTSPDLDGFRSLHNRLTEWFEALHGSMHPSKTSAAHIFVMHLHYYLVIVGLCKPLLESNIQSDINISQISYNAKIALREIISLYQKSFGWKSASTFFNHALTYGAFNAIPYAQKGETQWLKSLENCISGLWYISFSFPVCRYLLRAVQHAVASSGFSEANFSPQVRQELKYFASKMWKKSLLESLESNYSVAFNPQSKEHTVEGLLSSVENLSVSD